MAHKKVEMIAKDGAYKPTGATEVIEEEDALDAYKRSQRLGPPPANSVYVPPMPDKGNDYDLEEEAHHDLEWYMDKYPAGFTKTMTEQYAKCHTAMQVYIAYQKWCGLPVSDKGSDFDLDSRVNHPSYYNQGPYLIATKDYKAGDRIPIECIDIIRDMPTWKGNVFKYLWRCGLKKEEGISMNDKELEDMEKALFYLKNKIEHFRLDKISNGY